MTSRLLLTVVLLAMVPVAALSQPLTLDECRRLALANNKQLGISRQQMDKSRYQSREAFAAYLPSLDFSGGYVYNQKNLSVFDSDQLLPTKTFDITTGRYEYNLSKNPATGEPLKTPDGQYVPETVALIPKESMTYDIHNVFFGAVTLTQPVFMGGKIVALNRMSRYAESIASQLHQARAENVVYAVDAAYWQVVSLKAKYRVAESYVNTLDTLHRNVKAMADEGVATRGDLLGVAVKLNEAQVDLTKVENGLVLSRMALARLCGLPLDSEMSLADEDAESLPVVVVTTDYDLEQVYNRRHDLQAMRLGVEISRQKSRVAMSQMMPSLAVVGAYTFSNPNMYNGFSRSFGGAFSVGATLTVPLWHWGGNYNKYRAAKADEAISRISLADAQEQVALQVSQAAYKAREALKNYKTTLAHVESAEENCRIAQAAFKEGMLSPDKVMEAQTALLKARSENIDAEIEVRLCDVYFAKVSGNLNM